MSKQDVPARAEADQWPLARGAWPAQAQPGSAPDTQPKFRFVRIGKTLAGLGAAAFAAGLLLDPQRTWLNGLLWSYYLVGLSLGALCLTAMLYVSGAGWAVALRRVPEGISTLMPWFAAGAAAVLVLGSGIYPWANGEAEFSGFKGLWLSRGFFLLRAAAYLGLWVWFARAIVRHSSRQDVDADPAHTHANRALAAVFLVVFGLTVWLASTDWIMSLSPHWYSTIFGVYHFAGMMTASLALVIILTAALRKRGPLAGVVQDAHFHDLGKLLFGFTTFWAYIWMSQFLIIWYAAIPEGASYFVPRFAGTWGALFYFNVVLNWAVPFFALLRRSAKRNTVILVQVSAVVLLGRWLDLYLMTLPSLHLERPPFGALEAGMAAGALGVTILLLHRAFRRTRPVPVNDPFFLESLEHHT